MTDIGGSLAVASRGLFATGVSTDLNVTYLNSGGKIGDTIRAVRIIPCHNYHHTTLVLRAYDEGEEKSISADHSQEVQCDKFGKTLAFTSIRFMNDANELVARGSHTKYVSFAWKDENNITDEMKAEEAEGKGS